MKSCVELPLSSSSSDGTVLATADPPPGESFRFLEQAPQDDESNSNSSDNRYINSKVFRSFSLPQDSPQDSPRPKQEEQQLEPMLQCLFALSGATLQLPSLALLAIINDRVAIPPAYLPAYGAIAFLPHSLKPLYAALSTGNTHCLTTKQNGDTHGGTIYNTRLLALLLLAQGGTYIGTAWFIPKGGIVLCFLWGFMRGMTTAWSQFLMDQALIRQAQQQERSAVVQGEQQQPQFEQESHENGLDERLGLEEQDRTANDVSSVFASKLSYQALSSLFQSQAATYRHVGSLLASFVTMGVFVWRQYYSRKAPDDNTTSDNSPLSPAVVVALLLATASLSFAGALGVTMAGTKNRLPPSSSSSPALGIATRPYDALATAEDVPTINDKYNYDPLEPPNNGVSQPSSSGVSISSSSSEGLGIQRRRKIRNRSDVASLAFLQLLLVGAALQHPITAMAKIGTALWTTFMVCVAIAFGAALCVSSWVSRNMDSEREHVAGPMSDSEQSREETHRPGQRGANEQSRIPSEQADIIPARRLGIYLMLRHSVPIASILMYSYVYTIFAKQEPLFLQCLLIIESAVSLSATWFYGKFLAKKYHSGWGIIGLIAVLSIAASLLSLLDVLVVNAASEKTSIDSRLRCLVVFVSVVTYFMGQIGYMPSVVLATANVVNSSCKETAPTSEKGRSNSNDRFHHVGDGRGETDEGVYDEGIQYATFVACIDFGAQIGDWISVPIIAAFGITRENDWDNLGRYIVLCASMRIISVVFLYLIRPSAQPLSMHQEFYR